MNCTVFSSLMLAKSLKLHVCFIFVTHIFMGQQYYREQPFLKEMVAAPFHLGRFSKWPCLQILGSVTRPCVFILSSENMVPVPLHCWSNGQLLQKWSGLPPHRSTLLETTSKTWEGRSHVLSQSLQQNCIAGGTVVWNLDWTSWKPLMPWHKHWIPSSK